MKMSFTMRRAFACAIPEHTKIIITLIFLVAVHGTRPLHAVSLRVQVHPFLGAHSRASLKRPLLAKLARNIMTKTQIDKFSPA